MLVPRTCRRRICLAALRVRSVLGTGPNEIRSARRARACLSVALQCQCGARRLGDPVPRPTPPTSRCMPHHAWLCSVAHITGRHTLLPFIFISLRYRLHFTTQRHHREYTDLSVDIVVHHSMVSACDAALMCERHRGLLQAMFASSIPEIIELVGSRSKYSGELKREHGKRYPFDNIK